MFEQLFTAIKAAFMAVIFETFGMYDGASFIALIAALARLAYTKEETSFKLFGRFFTMSLAITMLTVHIGNLRNWDSETVIIVSGVSAFLCRELLEGLLLVSSPLVKHALERLKW